MNVFRRLLGERQPNGPNGPSRRWIFVPYDQLTDRVGALAQEDPQDLGIVVIESPWKAARRPYHKAKLALVLANLRHFALEQAGRGVAVRHVVTSGPYRDALRSLARELGPLRVMEPAERELRVDLEPLIGDGTLDVVPHDGWLTTPEHFRSSQDGPPWRMDAFYRYVRRETGILMRDGKPEGGKYSFDAQNRKPWNGDPAAPDPPRFPDDPVKDEVVELVETRFSHHPGTLDPGRIPVTKEDAEVLWGWALEECMTHFGPYEDAMSTQSTGLFHTRISPLLNLCRLLPSRVIHDVAELDVPLSSREGFIRQVLGWREFVRHVHRETDGFRNVPAAASPVDAPRTQVSWSDGGWSRWSGRTWGAAGDGRHADVPGLEGAADPSALGADADLPVAFWGKPSGLRCLDTVVNDVWAEGWSHHITRLMVLSNLATLLDVSPREVTDWFWVAYLDAFDWVVEPNVLAMGTFGTGELMTTKPYVSGANYINRMSDYCRGCRFEPKRNCPITPLYWAFLGRHEDALRENPRLRLPLASLAKRGATARRRDAIVFERVRDGLARGEEIEPDVVPARK